MGSGAEGETSYYVRILDDRHMSSRYIRRANKAAYARATEKYSHKRRLIPGPARPHSSRVSEDSPPPGSRHGWISNRAMGAHADTACICIAIF